MRREDRGPGEDSIDVERRALTADVVQFSVCREWTDGGL
ncbi:hypothetical protein EYZ11_002964 [Aspergillus tanneri]|uniref:Uncharacterized protein n=1 Tax=Aspergillus tanneri TaxID=1220188 RepID=A0A4S3JTX1_9EURO|nr:hypothetical protein EYZ11_002964 [Aspergillus tanneri]